VRATLPAKLCLWATQAHRAGTNRSL
jgi:hypothetical protein